MSRVADWCRISSPDSASKAIKALVAKVIRLDHCERLNPRYKHPTMFYVPADWTG